jgi:hypothetical protein
MYLLSNLFLKTETHKDGNPQEGDSNTVVSVVSFFNDYDTIFYDIPPSGSDTSHLEIVKRSGEYIGISIEDLQEEIRILREENVSLKNQIVIITK